MNTERKGYDPFTAIRKVPLYAEDGMQSRAYSVAHQQYIQSKESTVTFNTKWLESGVVGKDYLLIPNEELKDMCEEIQTFTPYDFSVDKLWFNGSQFVMSYITETLTRDISPGDAVGLGMMVENSYDQSRAAGFSLFAYRLVCTNGMIAPTYFSRRRFRHSPKSNKWQDEIRAAASLIADAPDSMDKFADTLRGLSVSRLETNDVALIRNQYLDRLGHAHWGKIMDKYLEGDQYTAFGMLNACTNEFWHKKHTTASDFYHNKYCVESMMTYA